MSNRFSNKEFTPSATQEGGNGGGGNIDWEGLNEHVAFSVQDQLGCKQGSPEPAWGVISGIVDYGKHQDELREEPLIQPNDKSGNEWRESLVQKGKAEVFDKNGVEFFRYQAPERQEVGIFVDFLECTVDKGQFFGDSNPAPYRVLVGTYFKGVPAQPKKVEGYCNSKNTWVFGDRSYFTNLAKAAGLEGIEDGFPQARLLELIGQKMLFNVETYINDAGFLQEKVTSPSKPMRGAVAPEYNEDLLFYVGMQEQNTDQDVKFLPKPVKEYIKSASDYEGSVIQKQLEALEASKSESNTNTPPPSENISQEHTGAAGGEMDDPTLDIPF